MKTAVITGAGSGVGRATAVALASQGWNVAILGRRAPILRVRASQPEQDESNGQERVEPSYDLHELD